MELPLNQIIHGDCLEKLKELPDNSVDSIVTDPPYELGFMEKSWDNTGIANNKDMWGECLRVLKPGGHLLSFGGTRTYHRMACAIEDAGFEVRDMIEWVYGSGFPKSLNIGKAVDKLQGNEREVEEREPFGREGRKTNGKAKFGVDGWDTKPIMKFTKGTSEWEGWGTALKPAHEPICMARKPLSEKTVAENCLKYGTGGINIDESRVGTEKISVHGYQGQGVYGVGGKASYTTKENGADTRPTYTEATGRFPANFIHDGSDEVKECFPYQKSGAMNGMYKMQFVPNIRGGKMAHLQSIGSEGSASRFFKSIIYTAKASKSERNKGCEGLEERQYSHDGRDKEIENPYQRNKSVATNNHPTVKPIALMEYLIKMITPKDGIVLDPFTGSGSTLVAAKQNGFRYIGIEKEQDYVVIAEGRLNGVENNLFNGTFN